MIALQGRVSFHLDLGEDSCDLTAAHTSRKRKRMANGKDEKQSIIADGFLFQCTKRHEEYWISAPQSLMRRLSMAAANDLLVRISRYSMVNIHVDCDNKNGEVPSRTYTTKLLEVHVGGLEIFLSSTSSSTSTSPILMPSVPQEEFLSLSHLRRREAVERNDLNWKKKTQELYHLKGTVVDAISPILALDPKDPFCLVELYDAHQEEHFCVLVLNGLSALLWQPALQPGDCVQWENLSLKTWQVPNVLQTATKNKFAHLKHRIPKTVFVFGKASKVVWKQDNVESWSIPPTPPPLVSVRGTIFQVQYMAIQRRNKTNPTRVIYYVDLTVASDPQSSSSIRRRLFLSHFPMSTSLQLSLRPGTEIGASNLHYLSTTDDRAHPLPAYGACLRSTVVLLRPSSQKEDQQPAVEKNHDDRSSSNMSFPNASTQTSDAAANIPFQSRSFEAMVPYWLGNIKTSYAELLLHQHVNEWLDDCFQEAETFATVARLPTANRLLSSAPSYHGNSGKRNPYAEFFDHAFAPDDTVHQDKNDTCEGCKQSRIENLPYFQREPAPFWIGLKDFRMISIRELEQRFLAHTQKYPDIIQKGWTGSIHMSAHEICRHRGSRGTLCVGGYVNSTTHDGRMTSISDCLCQLPIRFHDKNASVVPGDFVTGQVEKLIVSSFLFLAPKIRFEGGNETTMEVQSLPPLHTKNLFENGMGGGTLVRIGNFVLVCSVQLVCTKQQVQSTLDNFDRMELKQLDPLDCVSISSCLENPRRVSGVFQGALIRSRFRHAKMNAAGVSNCLVLTVSNLSMAVRNVEKKNQVIPNFLQTLDLKVGVKHDITKSAAFRRALAALIRSELQVLEEECLLGISWWTISETYETSPLVSGAWDESYQEDFVEKNPENWLVLVSTSTQCLSLADRGYVRASCKAETLEACFVDNGSTALLNHSTNFTFIGGRKFFDGMLCRRPRRTRCSLTTENHLCIGDLRSVDWWTSTCSLGDLFAAVCKALASADPLLMAPSMVRRLSGAYFFGIAYCSAECKCNRCFQPLVVSDEIEKGIGPSFWHLPLPGGVTSQSRSSSNNNQPTPSSFVYSSSLRCPNKCDIRHYYVHWECSGFFDDGTGQAKLYAEREAALSLIDFPPETLQNIEEALWSSGCRKVHFNKSIPPSKKLREEINYALARCRSRGPTALRLLSPQIRAEYLLQQHCRNSPNPRRSVDFFVRCKPLSDGMNHLSHTTIDTFTDANGGKHLKASCEVPTYTLPPLKLELVDTCVAHQGIFG